MTECVEEDEIRLEESVRSKRNVKVHGRAECYREKITEKSQ